MSLVLLYLIPGTRGTRAPAAAISTTIKKAQPVKILIGLFSL